MLVRALWYLLAVTLGLVLLLISSAAFLVGTQKGNAVAFYVLQHHVPAEVLQVESVEGRLADAFALNGLRFVQQGQEQHIERLEVRWQPMALWRRHLHLERVMVKGAMLSLQTTASEVSQPQALTGFRLPLLPFSVDLQLLIEDAVVQRGAAEALHVAQAELLLYGHTQDYQLRAQLQHRGGDLPAGHWQAQLHGDRDGAVLQALRVQTEQGALQADGELRWRQRLEITLNAQAADLALAALVPAFPAVLNGPVHTQLYLTHSNRLEMDVVHVDSLAAWGLHGAVSLSGALVWSPVLEMTLSLHTQLDGLAQYLTVWPTDHSAHLSGQVALHGAQLTSSGMRLRSPQHPGQVTLRGEWLLQPEWQQSPVALALSWQGLRWPLQADEASLAVADSPHGQLRLTGSLSDYTLHLQTAVHTPTLAVSAASLQAQGNLEGMQIQTLHAELLDGTLAATGELGWAPELRWALEVQTEDLDLHSMEAAWPQKLSLQARTAGRLERGQAVWDLALTALSAEVAGQALQATGQLQASGAAYQIAHLRLSDPQKSWQLQADNATLQLPGSAGQAQAVEPVITVAQWRAQLDLAKWLPEAAGMVDAQGQFHGTLSRPQLDARIQAKSLQWADVALEQLNAQVSLGAYPQGAFNWQLEATGLQQAGVERVSRLQAASQGQVQAHHIQLALQSPTAHLHTQLHGGLRLPDWTWQGHVQQLDLDGDGLRAWQMQAPAALAVGVKGIALEEACVQCPSCNPGRQAVATTVCTRLQWTPQGQSQLQAHLSELPARLFHPAITGTLSGRLEGQQSADGQLRVDARLGLTSGVIRVPVGLREHRISHEGGWLTALMTEAGLAAELSLAPLPQGRAQVVLALPGLRHWPPPPTQPIQAGIRAQLPSLEVLQVFLPNVSNTQGRLAADISIGGTLANPQLGGDIQLHEGAADIPLLGVALREITVALTPSTTPAQQVNIHGHLRSGQGRVVLAGLADLRQQQLQLRIDADERLRANPHSNAFSVLHTPSLRATVVPRLELKADRQALHIEGELFVPVAAITPGLGVAGGSDSPALITASPDVVISGQTDSAPDLSPQTPFRLRTDINVVLGRAVHVDAIGFKSRLGGHVRLQHAPDNNTLIPTAQGILYVVDGTFRAFGQDLAVEWGRILFNEVLVTAPELDIHAVRWIRDADAVQAVGVQLSGPLERTQISLFSRPAQLDAITIRSYLISGRGLDAGTLVLGHGVYLSDAIYVGYGVNLLERSHEFNLRYDILRQLGLDVHISEADKIFSFSYILER